MDYTHHWKRFLSETPEIEGGALIGADGTLIGWAKFGSPSDGSSYVAQFATVLAIAIQLFQSVEGGEFEAVILEGELGHIVLMPVLDKMILVALARKKAKVGLVLLDMLRAIDGPFGQGLTTEPIISLVPPKRGGAYARPEHD
jgi:uncharacterized protein